MAQQPPPKKESIPAEPGEMQGEKKLKLRAKTYLVVHGKPIHAGEEFELPEREALNLIGMQEADQIVKK